LREQLTEARAVAAQMGRYVNGASGSAVREQNRARNAEALLREAEAALALFVDGEVEDTESGVVMLDVVAAEYDHIEAVLNKIRKALHDE